jgi:hypothetical protein
MKLFKLTMLALLISMLGYSQSFELYHGGRLLDQDEVIYIDTSSNLFEAVVHVDLMNVSEETKNVKVSKEEVNMVTGMTNVFCWGICYAPTVYVSPISISVTSGNTNSDFSSHIMPSGNSGFSKIKYTFFDEVNPSDAVSCFVDFQLADITLDPAINLLAESDNNEVNLSWDLLNGDAFFGCLIFRDNVQISPEPVAGESYVDVGLEAGTYIYDVVAVYDNGISVPSNNAIATVTATTTQFIPVWTSPYNPMTVYVTSVMVNEDNLQAGDEIGIFDLDAYSGEEICVGAATLTEELTGGAYLEVIASMDDGELPDQSNGFTPGNDFVFKVFSQAHGLLTDVEFTFPYPGYDESFTSQGSAFVELQATYQSNQYFQPVWTSPYNPMTIYALEATLDDSDLMAGDEIGIFDIDPNTGNEICVGFGTLTQELVGGTYLEMIASMNDGSNPVEANGFTPGNTMHFKYFSQASGLVEDIEVSFPYPGYDEEFTSQGNAFVSLSGTLAPGLSFEPVWEAPFNPMTFYITEALLDGVDMDAPGQIGIFDIDPNTGEQICVGAATLEGIITPESYLEIIASMDDGTLPGEANGFQVGNPFIFKIISESGVLVEDVSYTYPYPGYNEVFASQGNAIVDLSGTSSPGAQQVITLNEGWTGISSYLDPSNPAIVDMTGGISEQLLMLQNLETFYQAGNSGSNLINWNPQSGYIIKISGNAELVINGNILANTTIELQEGWNLIPVLLAQPVGVETLFAGNLTKIEIIKDAVGLDVYWPEKSILTLIELQPGKAYMVKASENFVLEF